MPNLVERKPYQSFLHCFPLLFSSFLLLLTVTPSQRLVAQSAATSFRVMSYNAVKKPGAGFVLEQEVLGTDGTRMHPVTNIPRGFALEAVAQSGTRNLYMLRQTGKDSIMLLLTDSLGRTLQQPRRYMPKMSGAAKQLVPPRLLGLPDGSGFVLTYPSGKSSRPEIQTLAMSPDLNLLWQQEILSDCLTDVQHLTASSTHLWLILKEYLALAPRPRIVSLRLATGEAECNQLLAPKDELDVAMAVPAGLLILGVSDRKTSYTTPTEPLKPSGYRRDFALLLSPTGQRNFGVGLGWPLPGRPARYHWQSACQLADGSYQLVGETYRNIPNATTIALGVMGAGSITASGSGIIPLSGYINERPTGLVTAKLSTTGQLSAVHELAVPEVMQATGSTVVAGDEPSGADVFNFRFRGFSSNHEQVVLNTGRQVMAYSIENQQLYPLTVPRNSTPTVFAIEPARIVIGWSVKPGDSSAEFEQIALP